MPSTADLRGQVPHVAASLRMQQRVSSTRSAVAQREVIQLAV